MTSSGTQNIHLHPDASASHRAEITHFADVSRSVHFMFYNCVYIFKCIPYFILKELAEYYLDVLRLHIFVQYLIDFCLIIYNIITIIIDITAINDYCFLLYVVLTE